MGGAKVKITKKIKAQVVEKYESGLPLSTIQKELRIGSMPITARIIVDAGLELKSEDQEYGGQDMGEECSPGPCGGSLERLEHSEPAYLRQRA